jgi:hypothetical protein
MKTAHTLFLVALLAKTAFSQSMPNKPNYIAHAEMSQNGTSVTIHASSPRPVEQAISRIRRNYGITLDYEEGAENDPALFANENNRPRLKGADINVTVPEPSGSSPAEQESFLRSLLSKFHASGARDFTLLNLSEGRLTVTPTDPSKRVLDTPILLEPKSRSIDATIDEILKLVNVKTGITIVRGGLIDNDLANTKTVVGTDKPIPAREALAQALDGAFYRKFWILTWEPSDNNYVIGIQTAVREQSTSTGTYREIPIRSKQSE